jgi:hypothetical protein
MPFRVSGNSSAITRRRRELLLIFGMVPPALYVIAHFAGSVRVRDAGLDDRYGWECIVDRSLTLGARKRSPSEGLLPCLGAKRTRPSGFDH